MQVTREVAEIINSVVVLAKNRHYELVTPELVLYVICGNKIFAEAFEDCGGGEDPHYAAALNIWSLSARRETHLRIRIETRSFPLEWEPCCLLHGSRRRAAGKMSSD